MADEQALAIDLDRALAGDEAPAEARELAALLRAAAEPSRLEVSDHELERALRSTHRPPRRLRPLLPGLALAATVAVAALVAFLVRTPGSHVQANAARALEASFFVVEQIQPGPSALFPATDVTGYFDGRTGRAHFRITRADGQPVAETVLHPDGSVERWLAASNTTTIAPSCDALPGGCSEALDPLDLYARTLDHAHVRALQGAYELTIRAGRVEQRVRIDARTYLPRRIEWRQLGVLVSETRVLAIERQRAPIGDDAWAMSVHPGERLKQLAAHGRPVRIESVVAVTMHRGMRWLGPSYEGYPAQVADVRLTGETVTRITYGPVTVWNYRSVIPPPVVQRRGVVAKVFPVPGGVVHASFGETSGVVADASFADGNVAIVSSAGDRIDTIRAIQQLVRAQ